MIRKKVKIAKDVKFFREPPAAKPTVSWPRRSSTRKNSYKIEVTGRDDVIEVLNEVFSGDDAGVHDKFIDTDKTLYIHTNPRVDENAFRDYIMAYTYALYADLGDEFVLTNVDEVTAIANLFSPELNKEEAAHVQSRVRELGF